MYIFLKQCIQYANCTTSIIYNEKYLYNKPNYYSNYKTVVKKGILYLSQQIIFLRLFVQLIQILAKQILFSSSGYLIKLLVCVHFKNYLKILKKKKQNPVFNQLFLNRCKFKPQLMLMFKATHQQIQQKPTFFVYKSATILQYFYFPIYYHISGDIFMVSGNFFSKTDNIFWLQYSIEPQILNTICIIQNLHQDFSIQIDSYVYFFLKTDNIFWLQYLIEPQILNSI
eukprot:TRINITY_DN1463_c0_g1_i2.p3 TRINITY_DN1463_c0_g1~~TRINITY_DN1463_c0_g1_i2.p3  ORF type:complete len:227 (-),score=-21.70 TRINITY_DN1463_c0_g1_i2:76-756(-)